VPGVRAHDESTKVVEHHDVAWVEARDEAFPNKLDEPGPVYCVIEDLVGQNAISAHGSDDADVSSTSCPSCSDGRKPLFFEKLPLVATNAACSMD